MKAISFVKYDPAQAEEVLYQMYDILYTNMSRIAPTGCSREEDRQVWLSYMMKEQVERQILLIYAGENLAGYFQYRIDGETLCADEIELSPQYQRTFLFYRFLRHMAQNLPKGILRIRAYINKQNLNSQAIAGKLGL